MCVSRRIAYLRRGALGVCLWKRREAKPAWNQGRQSPMKQEPSSATARNPRHSCQGRMSTDRNVIRALEEAANRGLDVRVMLEPHPFGGGSSPSKTLDLLAA